MRTSSEIREANEGYGCRRHEDRGIVRCGAQSRYVLASGDAFNAPTSSTTQKAALVNDTSQEMFTART